jgi:hypothetical protein
VFSRIVWTKKGPSSCLHRASIVSKHFFIIPTDAHNCKITGMLKTIKIPTIAPTCFDSRKNHHQGAISCLTKTTNMILLCSSLVTWSMLWRHTSLLCKRAVQHACTCQTLSGWSNQGGRSGVRLEDGQETEETDEHEIKRRPGWHRHTWENNKPCCVWRNILVSQKLNISWQMREIVLCGKERTLQLTVYVVILWRCKEQWRYLPSLYKV